MAASLQVRTCTDYFHIGAIITWCLYRSESPSQVFFILLTWLQAMIASGTVSAKNLARSI